MTGFQRFVLCKACGRNANEGFNGPPECDLQILPAQNGTCPKYTKELAEVKAPEVAVTIGKEALVGALALLKPVATRSRFAGSQPIMVAVGPDALELRAVDGETDVRIGRGIVNGTGKRAVVPLEVLLAAMDKPEVKLTFQGDALSVCGNGVAGVKTSTLPGPFTVGESGTLLEVPPLTESCTYLVRAVNREESRPALSYVLMELPDFTFVATDGHRLHVQRTKPGTEANTRSETNVLLTKEQLSLLWESPLKEKQLATTSKGCVVLGTMGGMAVEMAFTTGVGQFPEWRTLLDGYEHSMRGPIEAVRKAVREEGKLFRVGDKTNILKEHLRDVIVGWVDAEVEFKYQDHEAPVVVNGSDRLAVVLFATEVVVKEPVVEEGKKMKKEKVKKAPVQTSAQPATMAVPEFQIGQTVPCAGGQVLVLRNRTSFLVQLPSGKKRWFSQDGLKAFLAGQPVTEDANEAAA